MVFASLEHRNNEYKLMNIDQLLVSFILRWTLLRR